MRYRWSCLAAKAVVLFAAGLVLAGPAARGEPAPLKERWFFSCGYGCNTQDVEKIMALVDTAAAHGLNGMVLSSFSFDSVTRWKEKDVTLLKELEAYCSQKKIELIPCGFSVGYGGGALGHDRSFAAALPAGV